MLKTYYVLYLLYRGIIQDVDLYLLDITTMDNHYDGLIKQAVEIHLPGYDWRLYKAQLWQESRLKPDAVSPVGAGGIAQIMPATWEEWSPRAGYPNADRFNPEASIMTGAAYMAYLLNEWNWPRPEVDRNCLALASYNSGLGDILKAQKASGDKSLYAEIIRELPAVEPEHAPETIGYVEKILGYCNTLITRAEF